MKNFKRFFALALLSQIPFLANAQSDDEQLKKLEKYIENTDQAGDYNDLVDQLNYGINKKLNLNKATTFELLSLNILTPTQVRAIIKHRLEFGAFISVLEIQTIDEIHPETVIKLLPILTIEDTHLDLTKLRQQIKNAKKDAIGLTSTSRPLA